MKLDATKSLLAAAALLLAAGCGGDGGKDAGKGSEPSGGGTAGSIFVYCAAGVKLPVEEIARQFTAETGTKVEITYANSGQLLGQIETTRLGDVYIPGEMGFAEKAAEKKLTAGPARTFCWFVPIIYVQRGNPRNIREVSDLARPGLKLVLADKSSAVGQLQKKLFEKNSVDEGGIRKNSVASPPTVTDVALAVKLGTADAGIVWDALRNFAPAEAEAVAIPSDRNVIAQVTACALSCSRNPRGAASFIEYLLSEKGRAVLREKRFTVDRPE
jgi:molybdate transport system substrate-binding protein